MAHLFRGKIPFSPTNTKTNLNSFLPCQRASSTRNLEDTLESTHPTSIFPYPLRYSHERDPTIPAEPPQCFCMGNKEKFARPLNLNNF